MKIVINISDKLYQEAIKKVRADYPYYESFEIHKAIKNGTPLPKGHGRLIDADELKKQKYYDDNRHEHVVSIAYVDWQPTIIEADKESD